MKACDIIISTYNRASHFLPRAIRSVQAQTHTDWLLWVADDCSTDDTAKVVRAFAKEDPRVQYVCTLQNSGYQCAPKNLGIRAGTAPCIAYLDDDNAWHPDHLERLGRALDEGGADFAYCGHQYANDPCHPHDDPPILGRRHPWTNRPWDPQAIRFENWIDTSDIFHTRKAIERLGGWDENCRRAADHNLMVRAAQMGMKVVHLPEILTDYYWHGQQNIGRVPLNRPAIWSLTKNRLYFVQRSFASLAQSAGMPYDHYVLDQGSIDGTAEWLTDQYKAGHLSYLRLEPTNIGISRGSNHLLELILVDDTHSWVIKMDSDIEWRTSRWIERLAGRWRPQHILSPHILGLVQHPGGAPRASFDPLKRLGYVKHLGGAVNMAPLAAWKEFGQWNVPAPAHGFQDQEFSTRMRDKGWKLAHAEDILAWHLGNTPADVRAQERGTVL